MPLPDPSQQTSASLSRGPSIERGLLFDAFAVGDLFHSPARTITEADIVGFAGLSGDFNPLHVDEEYARGTVFRGRIAHGLLIQSIASGLASHTGIFEGTIQALVEMVIRYEAPVHAGDTIRIDLEVVGKDPRPTARRGWVRFRTRVQNQRGEVVIEGDWLTLMHRERPARARIRGRRAAERSARAQVEKGRP